MSRSLPARYIATAMVSALAFACGGDRPREGGTDGARGTPRRGGRVVAALTSDPTTWNPLTMVDAASRSVIEQIMDDLVHIDRATYATVAATAETWQVSDDGLTLTAVLRPDLRFSDGTPCTAADVVFSFECYLDPEIGSPQRDLLIVGGEPIRVHAVDDLTVVIQMAAPYAAADRLFDGFAVLPRHVLEPAREAGTLTEQWATSTPPENIVGLGPFRLREYLPGERVVLERNPFYWGVDDRGARLPYLDELVLLILPDAATAALRFEADELDVLDRLSPETFDALAASSRATTTDLLDLGAGLDFTFLFFNLNDLEPDAPSSLRNAQRWFRSRDFRRAVSTAIDREAIVHLVYRDRATAIATHVTPGYREWFDPNITPPRHDPAAALALLSSIGCRRTDTGTLLWSDGQPVEFSILVSAGKTERERMAAIIQADLAEIGITVQVNVVDSQTVIHRVFQSFDYDAAILRIGGGDPDPNPLTSFLTSSGAHHVWKLRSQTEPPPWQLEIDHLMRSQVSTLDHGERVLMYWRIQELIADHVPFVGLASPHALVGHASSLGNVRAAIVDDRLLWNADELYWLAGGHR